MAESKHVHKFRRKVYDSGNKIFYCTLPDCYFKIEVGLSLGKISICNRCNAPFEMNNYSIRLSKPHCPNCHKEKNGSENRDGTVSGFTGQGFNKPDSIKSLEENFTQLTGSQIKEEQEEQEEKVHVQFRTINQILDDDVL